MHSDLERPERLQVMLRADEMLALVIGALQSGCRAALRLSGSCSVEVWLRRVSCPPR